ncbi:alpha,alpha-trehalose phosphorylase [Propionicimonas paludicola]|uniref:Alpha,alpha-trehalose phosphorylase n=1 Tax=Propionicimonas paludicola TaxID=185243 RepID=A0A2A9CXF7_9ACTN|nr:alpha,alpha-trehalose phosphorylase [Propionicimonas paludicola]
MAEELIDRARFPLLAWGLGELRYETTSLGQRETIFAVGNGYLGLRGEDEEATAVEAPGCFLNGFHETWPIKHAEAAYGFAKTGQTIINVPDAKLVRLSVDGQTLDPAEASSYSRVLDFRTGVLRRELSWRTASGKNVRLHSSRLVSFVRRHVAQVVYEIEVDAAADVVVTSELRNRADGMPAVTEGAGFDPRRAGGFGHRVLVTELVEEVGDRWSLGWRTANSGLGLAVGVAHQFDSASPADVDGAASADHAVRSWRVPAAAGERLRLVKWLSYHDGQAGVPVAGLAASAAFDLDQAQAAGVDALLAEQAAWLTGYWADADVELPGQPELQQAVRWCLFQLAQAAGRADGRGIGAKGVTGSGYEGHYFWDTEIYLVPFLTHTNPELARQVLRFRLGLLDSARHRARELAQRGALFAWRTINGDEASAYYAAGTAQYHINADVADALARYAAVNADPEFLTGEAFVVLIETARLWADLGFFRDGGFHLHSVTGPDEYSAVVNNNLYTNLMARKHLRVAAAAARRLEASDPQRWTQAVAELGLDDAEVNGWLAAADAMVVPYHEGFGVHAQDADFLTRAVWDLAHTSGDQHPLLLHYHPLVIYRHQVLKQADAVLAAFLAGDEFTPAQRRAIFEYYDPITTGDSTLSALVQSIVAAEVGYPQRAVELFAEGSFVDLADLHHNTRDGVHIASAGGVWNALVYGFGGLRDHGGRISIDPRLPVGWPGLRFSFRLAGSRVRAELTTEELQLRLLAGPGGELLVCGRPYQLTGELRIPLDDQGPELAPITGRLPLIHGRPATTEQISLQLPLPSISKGDAE